MDAPTVKQVREWSKVDFEDLGFEEPIDSKTETDPLARVVFGIGLWLQKEVGRPFSLIKVPTEPGLRPAKQPSFSPWWFPTGDFAGLEGFGSGEQAEEKESAEEFAQTVVDFEWIEWAMGQAVMMGTEYTVFVQQPEHAETAADWNQIASFSAGSYSETRRQPNSRSRGLHPWTDLADLLYDLMTDERLASINGEAPAISTEAGEIIPRWDIGHDILGWRDSSIMTPFGPFKLPWDAVIEDSRWFSGD